MALSAHEDRVGVNRTDTARVEGAPEQTNENDMTDPNVVTRIPTKQLQFDPENPRFYRLNDHQSVEAVIEEMLDDEGAQDLMRSIGQKGYFEGEPLLVVEIASAAQSAQDTGDRDSKRNYIVVEGNRRLAAVKLLNQELDPPPRRKNSIKEIREEVVEPPPTELPCLIYTSRRDVLRYLGYRHITGIKEWDSLSKAKYLSELREEFYKDEPQALQLKSLAKDIGSRSDYVGQLLTALNLYNLAEEVDFFGLPVEAKDVEFSYITTALNYKNIPHWLGLLGRIDIDMPDLNQDNLKKMFGWMFAKDQQGRTILGESRNLDQLAAVVASPAARVHLEETGKLDEAYLYTDGPESALDEALQQASQKVRVVWNLLPKVNARTSHLDLTERLFDDVKSIRTILRDKLED